MCRLMFIEISLRRSPSTAPSSSRIVTDVVDFVFGQIANLLVEIDARAVEQRLRTGPADAVDVGQPDLGPLLWR